MKLTSEMKQRLEAVTGDGSRKNSVRSNASSDHGEKRKRSEINLNVGGKKLNILCKTYNQGEEMIKLK